MVKGLYCNFKIFLPVILFFLFSIIFLGKDLNKKLIGHHDWNSVVYSSSARSLIGQAQTGEIFYQQDYPPLLPLNLSFSFLIFGIHEWSVRLIPVVFTFLTAVMIYLLTKIIWEKKVALLAAVLYLNTPLIRYFGKIPVHETITPFFAILVFYSYWFWFKQQNIKSYLYLLVSIFLAEQSGWPGYYPIPLLTLHYLFFGERRKIIVILPWWLLSIISFAIFLFIDRIITGNFPIQSLWQIFLTRTSFDKNNPYIFTSIQFLTRELLWLRVYLTRVLSFFVIVWFATFLFSLRKKKITSKDAFLILLGIFGLIHLLLFRQLCWLHDYMIIYLFPFLVIISAQVIYWIIKKLKIYYFIGLLIICSLMFIESKNFLSALERAQDFYPAYELGIFINKISKPGEKIFIASRESSKFYGVFFYFYANRNYTGNDITLEEFLVNKNQYQKTYRFIIIDENHNRLETKLIDLLQKNYQSKKIGQFQIFDLKTL